MWVSANLLEFAVIDFQNDSIHGKQAFFMFCYVAAFVLFQILTMPLFCLRGKVDR